MPTLEVRGDIGEFGVYEGVVSLMLGLAVQDRGVSKKVYLFDSWKGLPAPLPGLDSTCYAQGDYRATWEDLHERVKLLGLGGIIRFVPGWFVDTLDPSKVEADIRFSFVHVDADLYESYKTVLRFCKHRMNRGARMRFDEIDQPGPRKAVREIMGWWRCREVIRF
jgi:predicted O-methyltransferase YrrM